MSLRPFPGGPNLNPEWTSFWTLDEQRGGPPTCTADDVESAYDGLEVIAAGRAIGTVPIARLVWHSHTDNPIVRLPAAPPSHRVT